MSRKLELILVVVLVLSLGFLRFYNLSHSEYIPDETTVITPLKNAGELFSSKFLLNQRKGPLQFVVAYISFLFNKDIFNEGIFRIPFALASSLSALFFYLFVKNLSGRKLVGFVAMFLLFVNGLLVGLGRIVQY
ncbi:MAG: glycosyl transferase family 39, partial [Parcubacteria group bacterium]|nr:glycosyl transferase family 39 [Parcubacteria group bacterium]